MRFQLIKLKVVTVLAFAGAACSGGAANKPAATANAAPTATTAASAPIETAAAKSGNELYSTNCATCHKDNGKGGKVTVDGKNLDPDDLTTERMKSKTDEKLYSYVADGVPDEGMPAFKDTLKPDEIRAVVAHMRSL